MCRKNMCAIDVLIQAALDELFGRHCSSNSQCQPAWPCGRLHHAKLRRKPHYLRKHNNLKLLRRAEIITTLPHDLAWGQICASTEEIRMTVANNTPQLDNLWQGGEREIPPEVALWRAVIMQQLVDAKSNSKQPYLKRRKKDALLWLKGNSQDFHDVCMMANYHPENIRKKARCALANNCHWRKYNPNSYTGRGRKE